MSIATAIQAAQGKVAAAYTKCGSKGATMPATQNLSNLADCIDSIPAGGSSAVEPNDVNFYDYDGTCIASYTIAQAKALTQEQYNAIRPPAHNGLTFQEWNWTLNDIQTYNRRYIEIGANYITTDRNTHIRITIPSGDLSTYFRVTVSNGTLEVDWGDGTARSSRTSGGKFEHTYAAAGDYELILSFTQSADAGYWGPYYKDDTGDSWSASFIIKEWMCGDNVSLARDYGLGYMSDWCNISICKDTIMTSFFCTYSRVRNVTFPRNAATTGFDFRNSDLNSLCLPKTVERINGGSNVGLTQTHLKRIILPECNTMSSIGGSTTATVISYPSSWNGSFGQQTQLRIIDIVPGWVPSNNLSLGSCRLLLPSSLVDFLTKLGQLSEGTTITITLGSYNLNRLTTEQKAIATNKGYTLA